jgi:hypothetical protein
LIVLDIIPMVDVTPRGAGAGEQREGGREEG